MHDVNAFIHKLPLTIRCYNEFMRCGRVYPCLKLLSWNIVFFLLSCSSYEQFRHITEDLEVPSKIFPFGYAQTWQAVVQVMKKYDLEVVDQESGVIRTRWRDNTRELNFVDSFGSDDSVKAARYKLVVNISKGFSSGREISKVSVYMRQMIEQNFLQGWKILYSDGIVEKKILYRVGRVLFIENELLKIEKVRERELEGIQDEEGFFD